MKKLIFDIDNTITFTERGDYANALPNLALIAKLKEYKKNGFEIVLFSARNMRTYEGNIGKINANTLPTLLEWLNLHDVPFDEIIVGKPWCGFEGFYIDDRAVRPSEFTSMSYEEIIHLLEKENLKNKFNNER